MTIREAVGVFDDVNHMQEAIVELELVGFDRRDINVLGSEGAVEERVGDSMASTQALEDSPFAPHAANIKPEELHVGQGVVIGACMLIGAALSMLLFGWIAIPESTMIAAVLGTFVGVVVGVEFAWMLSYKYTQFFQRQINKGGLLVWVRTTNALRENSAQRILRKHGAKDVHIHDVPLNEKAGVFHA